MIRGTTPTHVFSKLPVLSTEVAEIWISYLQGGKEILTKAKADVTFEDNVEEQTSTASVKLSQAETLLFTSGPASVQVRILLTDDTALASDEVPLTVKRIIKNGEIE